MLPVASSSVNLVALDELVKDPQCGREIAEKDLVVEGICRTDES